MPGGREAAHVAADLGEDRSCRQATDAGDRGQAEDQFAKGGRFIRGLLVHARDLPGDLPIDLPDRRIERIPLLEMQLQQKAVMLARSPVQGIIERLWRGLDAARGQGGQAMRVALAGDHGFDHPATAHAHDVPRI